MSFTAMRVSLVSLSQHTASPLWRFGPRERRFYRTLEDPCR